MSAAPAFPSLHRRFAPPCASSRGSTRSGTTDVQKYIGGIVPRNFATPTIQDNVNMDLTPNGGGMLVVQHEGLLSNRKEKTPATKNRQDRRGSAQQCYAP